MMRAAADTACRRALCEGAARHGRGRGDVCPVLRSMCIDLFKMVNHFRVCDVCDERKLMIKRRLYVRPVKPHMSCAMVPWSATQKRERANALPLYEEKDVCSTNVYEKGSGQCG